MQIPTKLFDNQHGYSPIIGIIAIVLVIGLAFGGWYVWDKQQDSSRSSNQSNSQSDDKKSTETDNTDTIADPTEGGKYLVIKEWGVRFELPSELRGDVEYGIRKDLSTNEESAAFTIIKIANLPGSNCGLKAVNTSKYSGTDGGVGVYVSRTSSQMPEDKLGYYATPNMHIGQYWYSSARDKYGDDCVNNEENRQATIDASLSLTYSLDSLKPLAQ